LKKKIFIIGTPEEFEFVQSNFSREYKVYASNFSTYYKYKSQGVIYLYDEIFLPNNSDKILDFLSVQWYRDKNDIDLFYEDNFSVAPLITRALVSAFANDYRNYYAISKFKKNIDCIYISKNCEGSLKRVIEVLNFKVEYYNYSKKAEKLISGSPERTKINPINLKKIIIGNFLFILDTLFSRRKKRKNLVFNDWTYREAFLKKEDFLLSNDKVFHKGFYVPYGLNFFNKRRGAFFNNPLSLENFTKKISGLGYGWNDSLSRLFFKCLEETFISSIETILILKKSYRKVLDFYKPKKIILPGETYYEYLIVAQLASKVGIEKILLIDGYQTVAENTLFYKDYKNKNMFFDRYCAFSEANKQLLEKYHHIEAENIIEVMSSLAVKSSNFDSQCKKEYDAIILAPMPYQIYPNSRFDKRHSIGIELAKKLLDLGLKKIAIKIKPGVNQKKEESIYNYLIKEYGMEKNVFIISGKLSKFFHSADFFITQFSSALFELIINNQKFILFEHHDSGLPLDSINSCSFIDPIEIVTDIKKISLSSIINPKEALKLINIYENKIENIKF